MTYTRILSLVLAAFGCLPASADEPSLFVDDRISGFRLSPDGSKIAYISDEHDIQHIEVMNLGSEEKLLPFSTNALPSEHKAISRLAWVDNTHLYAEVYELTDGVAKLSDTRNRQHKLIIGLEANTPIRFIQTSGTLLSTLPQTPQQLLYAVGGSISYVYRIDVEGLAAWGKALGKTARVDGGQFSRSNRLTEIEGFALNWLADNTGEVLAVMYWDPEDGVVLAKRPHNEAPWETAKTWRAKKAKRDRRQQFAADLEEADYRLLSLIPGSQEFLVLSEADNGRQAVQRVNFAADTSELVYQHPSAEIVGVQFDYNNRELISASYFEDGYVRQHYFQSGPAAVNALVRQQFPNHEALVVGLDAKHNRYAILLYANNDPGRVAVFDATQNKIVQALSLAPSLDGISLSPSIVDTISNGGVEVEYFITKPNQSEPSPLIVYPHGGPFGVVDDRQFDPAVQFLAAKGFAILQVNYRGSGGYGSEFLKAGKGQFGHSMLEDIEQALSAAVADPSIDGNRICVMGDSYGGYAALTLAIRAPERYRCLATFAGVTDLGLILSRHERSMRTLLLDLFVGQNDEEDPDQSYARLKALSPLYALDKLKTPVLLTHGMRDRRVDIEHAYRLKLRLEALGKPFEMHIYPDEGHGFDRQATYFEHMQRVAEFIERHMQ